MGDYANRPKNYRRGAKPAIPESWEKYLDEEFKKIEEVLIRMAYDIKQLKARVTALETP